VFEGLRHRVCLYTYKFDVTETSYTHWVYWGRVHVPGRFVNSSSYHSATAAAKDSNGNYFSRRTGVMTCVASACTSKRSSAIGGLGLVISLQFTKAHSKSHSKRALGLMHLPCAFLGALVGLGAYMHAN
jgi:hypothetical protein